LGKVSGVCRPCGCGMRLSPARSVCSNRTRRQTTKIPARTVRPMNPVTTSARYTPDDLLRMPDGDRYELVDGNLVERKMSFWSSFVAGALLPRLADHCPYRPPALARPAAEGSQGFRVAPLRR